MGSTLVVVAALLMMLTASIHSLLGEVRLIMPLMRQRSGILASSQARFLLRLTWHMASGAFIALALTLLSLIYRPDAVLQVALASTGVFFLGSGLLDAVVTRGRHVGWPFLTAIGLVSLGALALVP